MKLLGISGTLIGSKPYALVQQVLTEAKRYEPSIETELFDLREYHVEMCDGRDPSTYNTDTQEMIKKIEEADCYIISTPVFQGSIPGALKNLFDLLPVTLLRDKVIGFVSTGGTYQHFLVVENQLKPIASYFKSYVAPEYVYAHRDHFNEKNEIIDLEVASRIQRLGVQVVQMSTALK